MESNSRPVPFSLEASRLCGFTETAAVIVWSGVQRSHNRDAVGNRVGHGIQGCPRASDCCWSAGHNAVGVGAVWMLVSHEEAGSCRFPFYVFLSFLRRTSAGFLGSSLPHAKKAEAGLPV